MGKGILLMLAVEQYTDNFVEKANVTPINRFLSQKHCKKSSTFSDEGKIFFIEDFQP